MKERPILFSGPMVKSILDGSKTMTRRVIKPQPPIIPGTDYDLKCYGSHFPRFVVCGSVEMVRRVDPEVANRGILCPYGAPGDRLWVRETFCLTVDDCSFDQPWTGAVERNFIEKGIAHAEEHEWIIYRSTDPNPDLDGESPEWKSSRFMPRWASRITLEVVSVRVERLQDISEDDAKAEGVARTGCGGFRDYGLPAGVMHAAPATYSFHTLWDSINGKEHPWESNHWVWVVEFRVLNDDDGTRRGASVTEGNAPKEVEAGK